MSREIALWSVCWLVIVTAVAGVLFAVKPATLMPLAIVGASLAVLWPSGIVLLIFRGVDQQLDRPRDSTEVS